MRGYSISRLVSEYRESKRDKSTHFLANRWRREIETPLPTDQSTPCLIEPIKIFELTVAFLENECFATSSTTAVKNTIGAVNNVVGKVNNTVGTVNNTVGTVNNTVGTVAKQIKPPVTPTGIYNFILLIRHIYFLYYNGLYQL